MTFSQKSNRPPRRRQNAIFFLQSFFFWGYFFKRKSVKGTSVSIDSASNYSNFLPFTHFFFEIIGTKKKFPKRNAEQGLRALDRATTRGEPVLKKWTKQPHKAGANIVRAKSKFNTPFKPNKNAEHLLRIYFTDLTVFFFDNLVDIFVLIFLVIFVDIAELHSQSLCLSSVVEYLGEIPPYKID